MNSRRTALWSACRTADATLLEQREAVLNNGDGLPFDSAGRAEVAAEDLSASEQRRWKR